MKRCSNGHVKQAEADTLIVSTALSVAEAEELPVLFVDTDSDLLVMFVALASATTNVYIDKMLQ